MTAAQTYTAALATLAVWTYLYKDNPVYRLAEHLFVALYTGWWIGYAWQNYIKPVLTEQIVAEGRYGYLIFVLLGVILYARYIPGISWLARYPMSFMLGYGAGYVLAFQVKPFLGQVTGSFVKFDSVNNVLLWIGIIGSLVYFFFTVSKENAAVSGVATFGKWVILVALGAAFGNTVLFRYNLLLGRMQFMLNDVLKLGGG